MNYLQQFYKADIILVLVIALLVTASYHFLSSHLRTTKKSALLEKYLSFCEAFGPLLHFVSIVTVIAFGHQFGWMEMVKLIIACLVMPILSSLLNLVIPGDRGATLRGIIALPMAIYCMVYIFPRLSWFGTF